MTLEALINEMWPLFTAVAGIIFGTFLLRKVVKALMMAWDPEPDKRKNGQLEKAKRQPLEKPKRQLLALGDDGELTEDWELVINPEGVKDGNSD